MLFTGVLSLVEFIALSNFMYIFVCPIYFIYLTLWSRICAEDRTKTTENNVFLKQSESN
jgi:hypothetical protein